MDHRNVPGCACGAEVELSDHRLLVDRSGALIWPERSLVVVADLHFEKASAFARRGQLLPPYDTRSTLDLLEDLIHRVDPRRVISLGDGFHDLHGAHRLAAGERRRLNALVSSREWIWVLGNHDPEPPASVGGTAEVAVEIGGVRFRHVPLDDPLDGEVAGHLHPVARLHRRGRSVRRACFVGDRRRIVLPAFGAFTGGLNVHDHAILRLFNSSPAAWLLGRRAVHRMPIDRLEG